MRIASGLAVRRAIGAALAADTVSIATMERCRVNRAAPVGCEGGYFVTPGDTTSSYWLSRSL
jgi:hypothetical protein